MPQTVPAVTAHLALSHVRFAHARATGGSKAEGEARQILDDADLEVRRGDFVLLTGPSGAGKSTLLRLFCRLEEPQEGQVLLNGQPVSTLPPAGLRRRVSYLQQTPTVSAGSVRQNLLLPFTFKAAANEPKPSDAELAALLGSLAAGDIPLDQEASTLSVGQRQRLCLARALLTRPEALLLDEPTSALDPDSASAVLTAAESFCLDSGGTVLLVSHADFTPTRVSPVHYRLEGGRLAWMRA
ncbi:MAG: ABC transporter ATP-binding protein [Humidesulfovibrio sp.]|nr:ABC transporter ATP-binding protein [Humidesulfovibrio sp.]